MSFPLIRGFFLIHAILPKASVRHQSGIDPASTSILMIVVQKWRKPRATFHAHRGASSGVPQFLLNLAAIKTEANFLLPPSEPFFYSSGWKECHRNRRIARRRKCAPRAGIPAKKKKRIKARHRPAASPVVQKAHIVTP